MGGTTKRGKERRSTLDKVSCTHVLLPHPSKKTIGNRKMKQLTFTENNGGFSIN